MYPDHKDLLSAFHAHGVKYLIVGGHAVSFHAQPRATKDIDLFVKADLDNARAILAALASFGAPIQQLSAEDLSDPNSFIRFGRDPLTVDILPDIPGVGFDAAWQRRFEAPVDPGSELRVNFISREDLIASKLAAGRPQDLADVRAIRLAHGECSSDVS